MENKTIYDTAIYVVCTPDGTPIKAYSSEKMAKKYLIDRMMAHGDRFSYDVINLEVDSDFIQRLKIAIEMKKEAGNWKE